MRVLLSLFILLSATHAYSQSTRFVYSPDPWLGHTSLKKKSPMQEILWSWMIPQSWIEGSFQPATIFVTGMAGFSSKFLNLTLLGEESSISDPKARDLIHGHLSLVASHWGDGKTMSPVSPQLKTMVMAKNWSPFSFPPEVKSGLQPTIGLYFWEQDAPNFEMFRVPSKDISLSVWPSIWPLHARALYTKEDDALCTRNPVVLISESVETETTDTIPDCAADFTGGLSQTTGIGVDGMSPVFLDGPWILQSILAGALGHLVSVKPNQDPRLYVHVLRMTARDYGTLGWSFGQPQISRAVETLLHHEVPVIYSANPIRMNRVFLLRASSSQMIAKIETPRMGDRSKMTCKHTPLSTIRCLFHADPSRAVPGDVQIQVVLKTPQGMTRETVKFKL